MKIKYNYIIIFLLLLIIITLYYFYKNEENFDSLNSILTRSVGFYSQLFFILNHYIYCKNNKINFRIISDDWTYKSEKGWEDYFEPIILSFSTVIDEKDYSWPNTAFDYSIKEYEENIPELYKYNEKTKIEIEKIKNKFNLTNNNYDFIYIRRGDKISTGEAQYVNEEKYVDLLLNKNPNCKVIFLQTDDYSCYKKITDYINEKKLNITVYTNSDENNNGANQSNIQSLNSTEIYNHTIEMLSAIDISRYSNICIVDYDSNVSRFIKLYHEHPENVYDINNKEVDYEKKICPSYSF
jgi:hypothetical protein